MVKNRKSQAAMEFLMTYGWTILVVLLVAAALVYFDVLNPSKFLPDMCNVQGFTCEDFRVNTDTVTLYLTNNIGDDITISEVIVGSESNNFTSGGGEGFIILQLGKATTIDVNITTLEVGEGDRFKETIKIKYSTKTSGISHTNIGEMATIVES